jgi:hypothetical protein
MEVEHRVGARMTRSGGLCHQLSSRISRPGQTVRGVTPMGGATTVLHGYYLFR